MIEKIDTDLITRVFKNRKKDFLYVSSLLDYIESDKVSDISEIEKIWKSHLKSSGEKKLYLYVDIPFCPQRCLYCEFISVKPQDNREVKDHVDQLINHFHRFKKIFKNHKFENLYIGGGTPSILDKETMEKMLSELFSAFRFDDDGMKNLELDTTTSSLEKLKLIRKFGFNRVSFGVQSFDPNVLDLNNRGCQNEKTVMKAIGDAKRAGFSEINIDLMFGIYGDNDQLYIESLKKALDLDPHSICTYLFHPKKDYFERFGLKAEEYFKERRERSLMIRGKIKAVADSYNYDFPLFDTLNFDSAASGCFYLYSKKTKIERNPEKAYALDSLHKKIYSVIGFGPFSMSRTSEGIAYRTLASPDKNSFYKYSVNNYGPSESMIRFVLLNICHGKELSDKDFFEKFNRSALIEFREPIKLLKDRNLLEVSGNRIIFHTNDYDSRFFASLFFLKKNHLRFLIGEDGTEDQEIAILIKKRKAEEKRYGIAERVNRIREKLKSLTEGDILKIRKDYFVIKESKGESKISFAKDALFMEICFSSDKETLYERRLHKEDLFIGDGVSIFCSDNGKALLVRRIVSPREALDNLKRK